MLSFFKYFFGSKITSYFYLFVMYKLKKNKIAFTLKIDFILEAPSSAFTLYPKPETYHKYLLNEGMLITS